MPGKYKSMMNKTKNFVILGTDTNIGKTTVTCKLMEYFKKLNFSVRGLKPIASGSSYHPQKKFFENTDVLALQKSASFPVEYQEINWISLEPAIAPHIAAEKVNRHLRVKDLSEWFSIRKNSMEIDIQLIEGAGGVLCPLNKKELWLDWVQEENLPCILVVGMRLGCLNHALLSYHECKRRNITVVGWIANQIDPSMPVFEENLQTLQEFFSCPLLAMLKFNAHEFEFFHQHLFLRTYEKR